MSDILAVLEQYVTPLQRRVRGAQLAELAAELAGRERETGGPERLVSYVLRMKHIAEDKLAACTGLAERWQVFTKRYFKRSEDRARRQVLHDYITETVQDAVQRRADLAALERFLDYDALHERYLIERHELLVTLEIAVTFIAGAALAALDNASARRKGDLVREMIDAGGVEMFFHELIEHGERWQIRRAAVDGLAGLALAARSDRAWHGRLRAKHLGLAVRCATNTDDHPWLQGSAIHLVTQLQPELGLDVITKRLLDPAQSARDFLVRRQCVELLAGDVRGRSVLRRVLDKHDPSEHVRQGLADAFARAGEIDELAVLAGLDPDRPEPSPRVRAFAIRSALRADQPANIGSVIALVLNVLSRETDPLPLAIACDDVAALIDREPVPRSLTEPLLAALLALASHSERAPATQETAAATAERVNRAMTFEDRAWRDYLETVTQQIKPGRSWSVRLTKLRDMPPLPSDPTFLGRVMAELSRRDFPLAATFSNGKLVIWRGDRYRRRLWRILHELRSLRPNKRQAYRHTVGRSMRGHLRAPPGGLDEVTSTVVPGERVYIAEEGGWGRHVPTVDDMLDLPMWTGDPVRVYSSYGVTTIRPPSALGWRLRNRITLALRYAQLATLRVQSLAASEPHARQRYVEELYIRYGIEVTFESYEYATARALAPGRLAMMFAAAPVSGTVKQIAEQAS